MKTIEEMNKWNYKQAHQFFYTNAFKCFIPETQIYIQSMKLGRTQDLRTDENARKKILNSIKNNGKKLILIDGCSYNGKSTFALRLTKHINASIIDIDILCNNFLQSYANNINRNEDIATIFNKIDKLMDDYIYDNLEKIIIEKSKNGNVILVGSYKEVIYRTVIAKTLGCYFDEVISVYCCAKSFKEVEMMIEKREDFNAFSVKSKIKEEYEFSKRILTNSGVLLSIGMADSFIIDNYVSDMFV